ncbi:MAG: hypothetical protein AAFU78_19690, partial [Cyanobacteria bacterium J06633_2]
FSVPYPAFIFINYLIIIGHLIKCCSDVLILFTLNFLGKSIFVYKEGRGISIALWIRADFTPSAKQDAKAAKRLLK